jgi:hypothetical protein
VAASLCTDQPTYSSGRQRPSGFSVKKVLDCGGIATTDHDDDDYHDTHTHDRSPRLLPYGGNMTHTHMTAHLGFCHMGVTLKCARDIIIVV